MVRAIADSLNPKDEVHYDHMAKRESLDIKRSKSRSHKTAKRLAKKRVTLAAKGIRRNSVKFKKRLK